MGAAKNWILLANYYDSSSMGNRLGFDFAARVGCAFTPECQWADLYLNGNYAGLYMLSERNEVDPQRVDIPKENSFLISTDLAERREGRSFSAFTTAEGTMMRIRHAGMQEERIQEIWRSVENAIYSTEGMDPKTGKRWDELIDVPSWAQQFLLWEVFADGDACAMSQFFYYTESGGKLYAGPLWDMDNTLNCWKTQIPNVLTAARRHVWDGEQESLFYTLCRKEDFRQRLLEVYYERFRPGLAALSSEGFARYAERVSAAASMNAEAGSGNGRRKWARFCGNGWRFLKATGHPRRITA